MTKGEREELRKLFSQRAKVSKKLADQRAAELLAETESQLAAQYEFGAAAWADLTVHAKEVVKAADDELAARCRALGIPAEFRPELALNWYSRGQNASATRRHELRRVAQTKIEALKQRAYATIDRLHVDGLTILTKDSLESAEAHAFLAAMPTVEALMPADALETVALPSPPTA